MSALIGLYYRDGRPVASATLKAMLESLAHRGADAVGTWRRGSVGLGQRLLRTTAESLHEKLPLTDERAQLSLTADARIDNRAELLAALDFEGRPPAEIADSELILGAYRKWGEDCPAKLIGDFAFAIWDGRSQKLFCARDHFGVRQLYYHCAPKIFTCATEIKALFHLAEVPRRLNEVRLADYLLSLFEDKRATLYEQIYALPPGHSLTVDHTCARLREYWTLDPAREVKYGSDAEYAEAYLEIFTEAVRCRMRSVGPLGSALSGGLDSSAIACVARDISAREGREQLHTFSAIYDEVPECDERQYINAVLAQGGVRPHFLHPDKLSPLTDWEDGTRAVDEPLWNPQMMLHWVLYEQARRQNVRVLLDGFGGDFVVSYGVSRLTELARRGRWLAVLRETSAYARRIDGSFPHIFWKNAFVPLVPVSVRRLRNSLRRGRDSVWLKAVPLRTDFARRIGLNDRLSALHGGAGQPVPGARQRHSASLSSGLYPFALGVTDRTTAMFGIERRQPFMDKRLAEFCLALPSEQKLRDGWSRYIARQSLANILPVEVQWRSGKADHSANFNRGLATIDRNVLDGLILGKSGRIAEYMDVARLRVIRQNYLTRPNNPEGAILWRVALLARWLQRAGFDAEDSVTSKRDNPRSTSFTQTWDDNYAPV
jgi:asparagine synthase (glutamine-hydrolysing)